VVSVLAVTKYPQAYVDQRRAAIDAALTAYRDVTKGVKRPAVAAFEPIYFSNLVLVLDAYFTHRQRSLELKDGNPLNEVRLLCASILDHDGVMVADKQIKLKADQSILGYAAGDTIAIGEADFVRLAEAFFAEIEQKYG
jgi:hypothetical protein